MSESMNDSHYKVLHLLEDGEWHTTMEINNAANSSEGTRRLRELREDFGFNIKAERIDGKWKYKYFLS